MIDSPSEFWHRNQSSDYTGRFVASFDTTFFGHFSIGGTCWLQDCVAALDAREQGFLLLYAGPRPIVTVLLEPVSVDRGGSAL
jgi:predicted glycosyl hydrolase (DUF1957 family)